MFLPEPINTINIDIIPHMEYYYIPDEFFQMFKNDLPSCLIFIDSNGFQFEVCIIVLMESAYFIDGIDNIRTHYNLNYGSRIVATYCGLGYFGFQALEKVLEKPHATFLVEFNYLGGISIYSRKGYYHRIGKLRTHCQAGM
ncbi:hypothetical protein PIB30_030915 [Stylosanthes scabra]|uniref:Uncharacterized protein n=1 Tax=Stylosanthes scabra TaxID=79078 RepID=A0ABU6Z9H8_9FABA|nr:hypothetical protein [Stylosanthes scabra]